MPPPVSEPAATLASQRAQGYRFAAGLFLRCPQTGWLTALRETLKGRNHDPRLQAMADILAGDLQALVEPLAVDYTRLLGGLHRDYGPPPPYESVYREGKLMGETTLRVLSHYQRAGFEAISPEAGPQDHMGVELGFLALLAEGEAQAWDQGDVAGAYRALRQEQAFLDEHLMQWLPECCRRIGAEACQDLYRSAVDLIHEGCTQDQALVAEMIDALGVP